MERHLEGPIRFHVREDVMKQAGYREMAIWDQVDTALEDVIDHTLFALEEQDWLSRRRAKDAPPQ